jgi:hypothetical protein
MRQLVTWLLLMLAAPAAFAQGNPLLYIRPIITPATPTTADDVLLLFYARAGFQAYRINTSFSATGQQMTFTGCYQIANATISSSFIDSVKVGRLAVGTYTVSFISVEAAGGNQLCEGRRDTASLTFQVRSPLATTTRVGEGWAVYPTPAAGGALSLTIPSDKQVDSIKLLDAVGRTCYISSGEALLRQGGHWQLQLPALPTGAYILQLGVAGSTIVSHRVLLE